MSTTTPPPSGNKVHGTRDEPLIRYCWWDYNEEKIHFCFWRQLRGIFWNTSRILMISRLWHMGKFNFLLLNVWRIEPFLSSWIKINQYVKGKIHCCEKQFCLLIFYSQTYFQLNKQYTYTFSSECKYSNWLLNKIALYFFE